MVRHIIWISWTTSNTDHQNCLFVQKFWSNSKTNMAVNEKKMKRISVNTKHLYDIRTTSSTLVRRCTSVIQMFCVCWYGNMYPSHWPNAGPISNIVLLVDIFVLLPQRKFKTERMPPIVRLWFQTNKNEIKRTQPPIVAGVDTSI